MYVALTAETAPAIEHGEILIVVNILASSGLRDNPRHSYARHLADMLTAKTILSSDIRKEWQVASSTDTKILLLFNGSSKEFVGNPDDIFELKAVLIE